MDAITFPEYVDVLRERLFDYEALHGASALPDFPELMKDYAEVVPAEWPLHTYEELEAQGHLHPASGMAFGPTPFGKLSADGRYHVLQGRKDAA
jgi:hypothetical protein